ncbi:hypothetical protein HA402_015371 [Bradysia odoriphaga]|nr:hypothetical protein HA402_015371 [Bradysia odoriphaga]
MPHLVHSHKGKHSDSLKRKADRKKKFNVIIQDIVIDYNHAKNQTTKPKSVQKRKLLNDDWDWAPYPRRFKTQRGDVFENSDYLSDGLDDSQIVPGWEDNEQDSNDLLFCDDGEPSGSKSADIHVVTIDEIIEFDNSKSPDHGFEEQPISFDMEELCEIVATEEGNGKDITIARQEEALNMLLAFTNNPRLVLCDENPSTLKEIKQMEPLADLYDSDEPSQVEVTNELQNDCQIEEFKFARCFKCRRKVYVMQDCPRHIMKEAIVKNK